LAHVVFHEVLNESFEMRDGVHGLAAIQMNPMVAVPPFNELGLTQLSSRCHILFPREIEEWQRAREAQPAS
jgi:hypothetical protein